MGSSVSDYERGVWLRLLELGTVHGHVWLVLVRAVWVLGVHVHVATPVVILVWDTVSGVLIAGNIIHIRHVEIAVALTAVVGGVIACIRVEISLLAVGVCPIEVVNWTRHVALLALVGHVVVVREHLGIVLGVSHGILVISHVSHGILVISHISHIILVIVLIAITSVPIIILIAIATVPIVVIRISVGPDIVVLVHIILASETRIGVLQKGCIVVVATTGVITINEKATISLVRKATVS